MPWFVYILFCDKKTYYIGLTHDIQQRLNSHKSGQNIATKEFSIIELAYSEKFSTQKIAENRERQLKRWTVAKKKALIEGSMELLKQLSKTRSVLKDIHG